MISVSLLHKMAALQSLTDQELIVLIKQDQCIAFTEIYSRYWKLLYDTARNILGTDDIAKDIVQDVFISIWQRRNSLEIESVKPYLQQATRFAVFKSIRNEKVSSDFYERLAHTTIAIINDDPLLFKEQQALLNHLVGSLPLDCKEAYRLSREENMTYKQIAFHLNISEKTVEKRLSKSLSHIRTGLSITTCIAVVMFKM